MEMKIQMTIECNSMEELYTVLGHNVQVMENSGITVKAEPDPEPEQVGPETDKSVIDQITGEGPPLDAATFTEPERKERKRRIVSYEECMKIVHEAGITKFPQYRQFYEKKGKKLKIPSNPQVSYMHEGFNKKEFFAVVGSHFVLDKAPPKDEEDLRIHFFTKDQLLVMNEVDRKRCQMYNRGLEKYSPFDICDSFRLDFDGFRYVEPEDKTAKKYELVKPVIEKILKQYKIRQ